MKRCETAIIIKAKTRFEQLVERFNTKKQAEFYIKQSKEVFFQKKQTKQQVQAPLYFDDFADYQRENDQFYNVLEDVQKSLAGTMKYKIVGNDFLPNFIFSEDNLIIVIGQDGLVANTAKYVNGLPIIAVNPEPTRYDGVLLPYNISNFMSAVNQIITGNFKYETITMAEAVLNDGQRLLAFNDLYIGPKMHTSARYKITHNNRTENQSSSGILISTGAGSTGWLSSLFNMAAGMNRVFGTAGNISFNRIPWDTQSLVYVVREPFISKTSKAEIIAGKIKYNDDFTLESFMPKDGVIFSDGILTDFLKFDSGAIAQIGIAPEKAMLVVPDYLFKK